LTALYQTTHAGAEEGVALLFDMNRLFEAYVAAIARRALVPLGYKVRSQGPRLHLVHDGADSSFPLRPDLHISRGDRVVVLDTKWKRIDPLRAGGDVGSGDAYQMHAYAHAYAAGNTILLYPHHDGIRRSAGRQRSWEFATGAGQLSVATLDITRPESISETLRDLVEETMSQGVRLGPTFADRRL
jgi:5-methylcytosine-specific restriction enzyme subunit McrC